MDSTSGLGFHSTTRTMIHIWHCTKSRVRSWKVSVPFSVLRLAASSDMYQVWCIASLSVVVLQVLRYNLIDGEGVPFGLLGSGLTFGQISFLWSSELILSAKSCISSWKRSSLLLFLVLTCLLAAVIGPASAVLLLPRIQVIPAGGTSYWLNATVDQLWPTEINASSEDPVCSLPNATDYCICPSGDYESLRTSFGSFWYGKFLSATSVTNSLTPQLRALGGLQGFSFAVQSRAQLFPVVMVSGELRDGFTGYGTYAFQPPFVVATQQQQLLVDWYSAASAYPKQSLSSLAEYRFVGTHAGAPVTSR